MSPLPELVELTIVRSRDDLRRGARLIYSVKARKVVRVAGPIPLTVSVIAFISGLHVVAYICLAAGWVVLSYRWWRPELWVRRLPAWAFRPVTFRLSEEGVEAISEASRRVVPWTVMSAVLTTKDVYLFATPKSSGVPPVLLHRRTLTRSDIEAIDSMVTWSGKRFFRTRSARDQLAEPTRGVDAQPPQLA